MCQKAGSCRITNVETSESYIAQSAEDCKDDTDRSAYKSAVALNAVITMGKVIVQPIK